MAVELDADAVDMDVTEAHLRVILADGRELTAPLSWFPRLQGATPDQRVDLRLIGGGQRVHWPAIDEDIAVSTLLRAH